MDGDSDRERAHLRGPVKTVVDEHATTRYDPGGNVLSRRFKNPDGTEYGDTYTYDDNGQPLIVASHAWDGSTFEKVYSYDEAGRLLKITDARGETTTFEYDEDGHKIETCVLKKADGRAGAKATGIDLMFADTLSTFLDLHFGGNASRFKTIYNHLDRPTETQAYDAGGTLLGRVLRTFDEQGRVTDVREITEDPLSMFPAKEIAQMIARSGTSLDEVRAELSKAMKFFGGESGKSFRYDANGRVEKAIISGTLPGTFTRTYVYNEHGDVVEENTVLARDKDRPVGVAFSMSKTGEMIPENPPSEWPPQPDLVDTQNIRHDYEYDDHGNWTERTSTFNQQPSSTSHRALTYY
jgi:YD repeat-containing protein